MTQHVNQNSYQNDWLPLQTELSRNVIKKALFCHIDTRWYLGELFCHASWLHCLEQTGCDISICTNPNYLELFKNHPDVTALHADDRLDELLEQDFDIAIFCSTHPPKSCHQSITRAIYSWNTGLAYVEKGAIIKEWKKDEINLFRLTEHKYGQTALPDGKYFKIRLTSDEKDNAAAHLNAISGDSKSPVIILNPTASNPVTCQTDREKAVDNTLSIEDYCHLVDRLLQRFPGHVILIGATLKPGDVINYKKIKDIASSYSKHPFVCNLLNGSDPENGFSFRKFAALLNSPRAIAMVGNSTGSNAHMAAALDLPAISIERAADELLRQNWLDTNRGQMGSFRWRNVHRNIGSISLNWNDKSKDDFLNIADLLYYHLSAINGHHENIFSNGSLDEIRPIADTFLDALYNNRIFFIHNAKRLVGEMQFISQRLRNDLLRFYYFNFSDESDYMKTIGNGNAHLLLACLDRLKKGGDRSTTPHSIPFNLSESDVAVVSKLIKDSNLCKLLAIIGQ